MLLKTEVINLHYIRPNITFAEKNLIFQKNIYDLTNEMEKE